MVLWGPSLVPVELPVLGGGYSSGEALVPPGNGLASHPPLSASLEDCGWWLLAEAQINMEVKRGPCKTTIFYAVVHQEGY